MPRTSFSRIVVALDGSPAAERAIPVAAALAAQAFVPVSFVRVVPDGDPGYDASAYLGALRGHLAGHTDQEVLHGVPAAGVLRDYLDKHRQSLLCCATHARSGLGELLLGSVAEELVRRSRVPIVLVGPNVVVPTPDESYREVVLCIEDDSAWPRLLPFVADLCLTADLHPWLLQVVASSMADQSVSTGSEEAGALLRLSGALAARGLEAGRHVAHNPDIPGTISSFAASLPGPIVIVSSRQRSLRDRLRAGSVAVDLARTAPCPVLVVGPSYGSDDGIPSQAHTTA